MHAETRAGEVSDALGFNFFNVATSMIRGMKFYVSEFVDCGLEHGGSLQSRMDADPASSVIRESIGLATIFTAQGELPRLNGPEAGFNEALIAVLAQHLGEHFGQGWPFGLCQVKDLGKAKSLQAQFPVFARHKARGPDSNRPLTTAHVATKFYPGPISSNLSGLGALAQNHQNICGGIVMEAGGDGQHLGPVFSADEARHRLEEPFVLGLVEGLSRHGRKLRLCRAGNRSLNLAINDRSAEAANLGPLHAGVAQW